MKGNSTLTKISLTQTEQLKVKESTVQQLLNYSKSLRIKDSKSMDKVEWVLN